MTKDQPRHQIGHPPDGGPTERRGTPTTTITKPFAPDARRIKKAAEGSPQTTDAVDFEDRLKLLSGASTVGDFLRALEVFKHLGTDSIEQLAHQVREESFQKSAYIIRAGESGDCMYVIREGEVQIPIASSTVGGSYRITLGPGQIIGEMALLTGEPRFNDVVALSDCRCYVLEKPAMFDLIRREPEVARFLTTIVGERLLETGRIEKVGKYRLLEVLGRGGMSTVYEGYHPILDRSVAVKMLSHELVYSEDFIEQFRREARILANLRHPHIVQVFDTEEAYGTFFIVMEKLSGMSLQDIIRERRQLDHSRTRQMVIQIASALHYAHQSGIVHCDVKPSNIVVTSGGSAKLADFGIALQRRSGSAPSDEEPGSIGGTPAYMAPEQVLSSEIDGRCDIYALGLTAFSALTGTHPFSSSPVELLHHQVHTPVPRVTDRLPDSPEDLDQFIRIATEKDPGERFQTGKDIIEFFGDDPQPLDVSDLSFRTLTVLFHRSKNAEVDDVIRECSERASAIPGVFVR